MVEYKVPAIEGLLDARIFNLVSIRSKDVKNMTKCREILRLKSLELSWQNIADNCNVSKKTVNCFLKLAVELGSPVVLMQPGLKSQKWIREQYLGVPGWRFY